MIILRRIYHHILHFLSFSEFIIPFRKVLGIFCKGPDFIIVGAQKAGTTSLYQYITDHPNIKKTQCKELHYYTSNLKNGEKWYRSFFPFLFSKKISGEATPYYFFHPNTAYLLKKDFPHARIIIILRDPVARTISHYKMNLQKGKEIENLENAISMEPQRLNNERAKLTNNLHYASPTYGHFSYVSRSLYFPQLLNWLDYFEEDKILFIKSEALFSDPKKEMKKVFDFLNLPEIRHQKFKIFNPSNYPDSFELNNTTKEYLYKSNSKLSLLIGNEFTWGKNC